MTSAEHEKLGWYYSTGQALFEEVVAILKGQITMDEWEKNRGLI